MNNHEPRTWHVLAIELRGDRAVPAKMKIWPIRGSAFYPVTGWARHTEVEATTSMLEYAQRVFQREGSGKVVGIAFELYQSCPRCAGSGIEPGRVRARCRGERCTGQTAPWPGLLTNPRGFSCTRPDAPDAPPVLVPVPPYPAPERPTR